MSKKVVEPREAIREVFHRLEIREQSILIAVSGGADSVSLLLLLHDLKDEFNLDLHIGHFDHRLRDDSHTDAEWVQDFADKEGLDCTVGTPESSHEIESSGIEESARRNRYQFLQTLADKLKARWIAVAHTQNDQVETVLHHIARGTGLKGLQGIPEVRVLNEEVSLVRPLLNVRREQLEDFLSQSQQEYRTDKTNRDSKFTRNRIRHEVLPYLKEHLNPQIDTALCKLSLQAQEAQTALEEIAKRVLIEATENFSNQSLLRLKLSPFLNQPRAIVISAMMLLWEKMNWPRQKMSQHHWSQLAAIVDENSTANSLSCPGGVHVRLRRKILEFQQNSDLQ